MFELEFLGEADDWEQRRLPRGESSAGQHLGPAWHGVLSGALFLPGSPVMNGERLFLRADGMIMPRDGMVMAWKSMRFLDGRSCEEGLAAAGAHSWHFCTPSSHFHKSGAYNPC